MYHRIKVSGIYKITHKVTGEYYVGQSREILERWSSHYNDLKMNKHSSPKFQELFNRSSMTDWTFEIIKVISKTEIRMETGLKGKNLEACIRKILLAEEKNCMNELSITYSLNKINKHFR